MKIMIDLDSLPKEKSIQILNDFPKNSYYILTQYDTNLYRNNIGDNVKIHNYPLYHNKIKETNLKNSPDKIWSNIINDHQTFMLYDREKVFPGQTNNKVYEISKLCLSFQIYLEDIDPDIIIFIATPHHIHTWIFARVAESMGIRVIYFKSSILPWRYYLCQGLHSTPLLISHKDIDITEKEHQLISFFIKNKKDGHLNAMPAYEKDRLSNNRGKYFNIKNEIISWWQRPDLILNKILCFNYYKKLTKNFTMPHKKYVVYFLHYQPERTTLPEGYGFAQQLLAIQLLSIALPNDCLLIVKEHPTTFTKMCSWKERNTSYYSKIHSLHNVIIAPIEQDAYTLIDRSIAVATITGTVSGEALIRGKPAIAFGNAPLKIKNHKLFHQYIDLYELSLFIAQAFSLTNPHNNQNEVKELIYHTFCRISDDELGQIDLKKINYLDLRNNTILNGINSFLSYEYKNTN
ncbi:hypothetical protein [Thiofilum flexile]|uniref:capsular polysaccharide export protein, LipB/KpsS family n=1 Tax=Thiofilum flexile TaxID=125627 RepID=UPI000378EAF4|nr:hypothetical protein [Thiofilum flexile]